MVARWERGWTNKVKKLRNTNWWLQNSHRAVERSIGNITATPEDLCMCQVGTRLIGGMTSYLVKHLYV